MTILVTGGAGFIGGHLCRRLLSEGHSVIAIDDLSNACVDNIRDICEYDHFKLLRCDVSDYTSFEKVFHNNQFDMIYHLASNTSVRLGEENSLMDINKTLLSTLTTIQLAAKYNVNKFVFTSSSTVYGQSDNPFTEESVTRPISIYGASKLASEAYVCAYGERYNIPVFILRLCNVIGKDMHHGIIGDIKNQIMEGAKTLQLLGTGKQEKPFLYVDDALEGIMKVVYCANKQYNLFLVGNDNTLTVRRIAEIATENNDMSYKFNMSEKSWFGDVEKYAYDITKIKSLGWEPRLSSEEAVRKSLL